MRLFEVESKEQMRQALAAKDPELERDLQRAVSDLIMQGQSTNEWEVMEPSELVQRAEHYGIMEIPSYFGGDDDLLATLPQDFVRRRLMVHVELAANQAVGASSRPDQFLAFATRRGHGLDLGPVYYELRVSPVAPLSWLPEKKLLELLNRDLPGDWQRLDIGSERNVYTSGWVEGYDHWLLEVAPYRGAEWANDLRQDYMHEQVEHGPENAIATMMQVLGELDPKLAKKIKKAKLPKEVLADYAVVLLTEDQDEGLRILNEAVGRFGYEGSRGKLLLTVDRDTLRKLGITQGRWWDGAPWKLIQLPPAELSYEGTMMRHCVGRYGMGYRQAVERGDAWIWSLRSQFDKPVLTFEVDAHEWVGAGGPALGQEWAGPAFPRDVAALRGRAIEQIKGKVNRLAGRDPDEARVLLWIFSQLGVDPAYVRDYVGPDVREHNPAGFDRPWVPYQQRVKARLMRW